MLTRNAILRHSVLLLFALLFCFLSNASGQLLTLSCSTTTGPTQAGVAYSATCTASGSLFPPYTWSISSGTLPDGLALTTSSDTTMATISGAPTTAGPYDYTLQATDSTPVLPMTAQQEYSGTIAPNITSINPATTTAGGPDLIVTVNGAGFGLDSVVDFNSTALATTVVSSNQVTATITADLTVLAGSNSITLTSAGETSNTAPFTVTPTVSSILPSSATAGGPGFLLSVTGTGFESGATVNFSAASLTATVASPTQLSVMVPASLITTPGPLPVSVTSGGLTSNSATFTVVPGPAISSIAPTSATAGGPAFTLTVNGSSFGSDSVVNFNGTALTTTVVGTTQVAALVPASLIVTAGTFPVTVTTGGVTSSAVNFTVPPAVSSISPTTATAGGPDFTLTVNGSGFTPGAVVQWNGSNLATSFVNATQLQAPVLVNLIATPGTAQVTVLSGGLISNPATFTVLSSAAITSIAPATVTAGGPAFTLTVNGSGFGSDTTVQWNGSTLSSPNVLSSSEVTVSVPANLIASVGSAQITVKSGGVTSNAETLTIAAGPALSTISPNTITAGSAAFTLIASGTGFASGAVVQWNGSALSTTFNSANQLTAAVPANLVASVGTAQVLVSSGGVNSNPLTFTITAAPTIASISPNTITAGSAAFTLTVNGSGFASGAVVQWNGSALATSFVNSTQLTAPVLANMIASPGTAQITVSSGGVASNSVNITIVAGPAIASLSPSTTSAGGPLFTLTVNGTGFASGAVVEWNATALTTTFLSSAQVTASVPANLIANASTVPVSVQSAGVTSNAVNFTVVAGPTLFSTSPSATSAGGPAFTLTVNGTGFASGAVVEWNSTALTTTFVSSTELTAAVPANLIAHATTVSVSVQSGGVTSNPSTFTVGLTLGSISPSTAPAGGPAFTLTANGTGFVSGAVVKWNGSALPTTFESATQLTAAVSSKLIQSYGEAQITVFSGGLTSNALPLSVGVPAITLTGLQSTSAPTQQLQMGIQLANPIPTALTGTLNLSFSTTAPGVPAGYIDPALQFAAGGTTLSFIIPAGSTSESPLTGGTIQQGTVEGTITVTMTSLTSGGTSVLPSPPPTATVIIPPLPPVITAGSAQITNLTASGFDVVLSGYSTTRDMTSANFTFTAASGTQFTGASTFTVPLSSLFSTWFSSADGQSNGSMFLLTVPFTISGDTGVLQSVSVTLTNSVGTSVPASTSQ